MRAIAFSLLVLVSTACLKGVDAYSVHDDFTLSPGCRHIFAVSPDVQSRAIETCLSVDGNGNANGIGKVALGITWLGADSLPVMSLSVRWGNECLGDPLDRRFMLVSVYSVTVNRTVPVMEKKLYDGVNLYDGYNTFSIEEKDGMLNIWAGNDYSYYIGECNAPENVVAVSLECNRSIDVKYIACSEEPDRALMLDSQWDMDELDKYLAINANAIEGIWDFLDRDTDMKWARPGGMYRLAVVKYDSVRDDDMWRGLNWADDMQPAYEIIYLAGARVNASKWKPGMVKGFLMPTIFENHFDLVWFDSYMEPIVDELWVDVVPDAILSFNFPLLHAQLRFSKYRQ